jgi:hypothetical protein
VKDAGGQALGYFYFGNQNVELNVFVSLSYSSPRRTFSRQSADPR